MTKSTISKQKEIKQVLESGLYFKQKYIDFFWQHTQQPCQLAISCAKKSIPRAVDRNYIKRLNRAQANADAIKNKPVNLFVRVKPRLAKVATNQLYPVIAQAWKSFLSQSKLFCSEQSSGTKKS